VPIERLAQNPVIVYLGLGSNLGDRQQNMSRAIDMMPNSVDVRRISSCYETEPLGYARQPRFLNAVCEAATTLPPDGLLAVLKEIECRLGRRPSFADAPRPMDIDILFYGDRVTRSADLVIPHPRIEERGFVLVPLAEISPALVHPVTGRTVREMLTRLGRIEGVVKWKEDRNV
jgi:2-amino-4-hydroxy-6-hydroxymethyldihydropteridine diphosphokinase